MPPLDSAVQEQGFRSSLFGFDKDDVLAYLSALTEEAQRQEQAHLEKEQQLQAQIDKLKNDQSNARACVETLQQQLAEAERRAALAEKQYDEEAAKLAASEQRAAELAARNREIQQNANELQFKCRDLQRQLDARPAESAVPAAASAPAVSPGPEPAAAAPAGTEPATPAAARLEARRILADARISAQNAEQRLNAQAEEQKRLMAENARGIAAGFWSCGTVWPAWMRAWTQPLLTWKTPQRASIRLWTPPNRTCVSWACKWTGSVQPDRLRPGRPRRRSRILLRYPRPRLLPRSPVPGLQWPARPTAEQSARPRPSACAAQERTRFRRNFWTRWIGWINHNFHGLRRQCAARFYGLLLCGALLWPRPRCA